MSELTTIQITKEYSRKLGQIATMFRRSKTAQVEWMIDRALEEIESERFRITDNGRKAMQYTPTEETA